MTSFQTGFRFDAADLQIHSLRLQRDRALAEIEQLKAETQRQAVIIDELRATIECHPDSEYMTQVVDRLFGDSKKHKTNGDSLDPTENAASDGTEAATAE